MEPSVSLLAGYLKEDDLSPATGREERTETDQASGEQETKLPISALQTDFLFHRQPQMMTWKLLIHYE